MTTSKKKFGNLFPDMKDYMTLHLLEGFDLRRDVIHERANNHAY